MPARCATRELTGVGGAWMRKPPTPASSSSCASSGSSAHRTRCRRRADPLPVDAGADREPSPPATSHRPPRRPPLPSAALPVGRSAAATAGPTRRAISSRSRSSSSSSSSSSSRARSAASSGTFPATPAPARARLAAQLPPRMRPLAPPPPPPSSSLGDALRLPPAGRGVGASPPPSPPAPHRLASALARAPSAVASASRRAAPLPPPSSSPSLRSPSSPISTSLIAEAPAGSTRARHRGPRTRARTRKAARRVPPCPP